MRILIVSADYPQFLRDLYRARPELARDGYHAQFAARMDSLFSTCDFYSRNFGALGHVAHEIQVNNIWLQTAWAKERGMRVPEPPHVDKIGAERGHVTYIKRKLRPYRAVLAPIAQALGLMPRFGSALKDILLAQIEEFQPDVVINQDIAIVGPDVMHAIRRPGRLLIAQCGIDPPSAVDLSVYNFGISLMPWVVEYFRQHGLPAEQSHLAFEPTVLDKLGPPPDKTIAVSFVGGLSPDHGQRIALLEAVARQFPIELWVSNLKGIPRNSPLHSHFCGEAWGREMYDVVRRSKITLNSHINAARGMAGNMRLYEATGVGTFLLTDKLTNLGSLFEPGLHVAAYESVDDCLRKIRLYLEDDCAREAIAVAGQQHTLTYHTYRHRAEELLGLIAKFGC
jgi:spore maturation protein CgeB